MSNFVFFVFPLADGVECEVFDIVFNPETISKSTEDPVFRQFVLEVSLENIRQKLDKELEPSMLSTLFAHFRTRTPRPMRQFS